MRIEAGLNYLAAKEKKEKAIVYIHPHGPGGGVIRHPACNAQRRLQIYIKITDRLNTELVGLIRSS